MPLLASDKQTAQAQTQTEIKSIGSKPTNMRHNRAPIRPVLPRLSCPVPFRPCKACPPPSAPHVPSRPVPPRATRPNATSHVPRPASRILCSVSRPILSCLGRHVQPRTVQLDHVSMGPVPVSVPYPRVPSGPVWPHHLDVRASFLNSPMRIVPTSGMPQSHNCATPKIPHFCSSAPTQFPTPQAILQLLHFAI